MQHLRMLTITPEYAKPLAGSGQCTIRKFDGKYPKIGVGDSVVMLFVPSPDARQVNVPLELLKVSATAVAPLKDLVRVHGKRNHGYTEAGTVANLEEKILSFYPVLEGQERDPKDPYIAIYF